MFDFLSPENLIQTLGLLGVVLIVFAESGLFFGFFFPGDSLLFTAGVFASQGYLSFAPLLILSFLAAVSGDAVGYFFGKKVGQKFFDREESFFFRKSYIKKTEEFYAKHGRQTVVLARFMPVVRTFAPILAGMGGMAYSVFFKYNVIGALIWAVGLITLGFFFGRIIPDIERYLLWFIIGIIFTSSVPALFGFLKDKGKTGS
ncbi:MAG: hypothetical protein UY17_C0022G0006 [Candidatus Beckwithbacteria bacterium GW2011_GWC2_47_9]|uniref:VTT domain-containing protein n=1 Tax=Candidatus Beckwithbacteria bacterium GW2011_GWC2_47_9 TaxID=1618373 RepID=A0A0G1TZP2_9BACT|nr:MAG: hypothetical protein UX94_C0011G0006 [Parcubacteria group bacterium GW2011_GWA2_47_21]KKU87292.1 MAG: hypothetical protein UY17_C0022G0006 [Candidatus Beckwithbacteria bacterium GW2011_GWC2_47_9]